MGPTILGSCTKWSDGRRGLGALQEAINSPGLPEQDLELGKSQELAARY